MRLRYTFNILIAAVVGLGASLTSSTRADVPAAPLAQADPTRAPIAISLNPGDRLAIACPDGVLTILSGLALCDPSLTATPTPTETATSTETATATATETETPTSTPTDTATATETATETATDTAEPTSTPTATETATATSAPSPTHDHGTPTAAPTQVSAIYEPMAIVASILGTCSAQVHDRYTAVGPDGVLYRTWHPQTVLIDPAAPALGSCTFAHEHGVDPATSVLTGTDPIVFGYEARLSDAGGMPMPEAHEGFKVHVTNKGQVNDESRVSRVSSIILFHMGTGGVRRYLAPMHTLHVQAEMPDGARINVRGMADTGAAGSICARDRGDVIIGRAVQTVPGVPESANAGLPCAITSPYEIWQFSLNITRNRAGEDPLLTFNASLAAFDPITTMDPSDLTRVIYTGDAFLPSLGAPWSNYDRWRGCDREFYTGSVLLRNSVAAQVWTDAHGNVLTGTHTSATAIRQRMVRGNVFDPASSAAAWKVLSAYANGTGGLTQFKLQQETCAPGLGLRN